MVHTLKILSNEQNREKSQRTFYSLQNDVLSKDWKKYGNNFMSHLFSMSPHFG